MIGAEDHARITAAIRQAEARTSGEIVCVLAHSSSAYSQVAALWAALLALLAPWLLLLATNWTVKRILLCQLAVFAVGLLLLSWAPLRMRLVPRPVARARAHRQAAEQFLSRGLTRTKSRCGLLIFVSLTERYARILPDDGLAARVERKEWDEALAPLLAHMGGGRIADGFVAAIERCGALLAERAPATETDRDELPDRLYVL